MLAKVWWQIKLKMICLVAAITLVGCGAGGDSRLGAGPSAERARWEQFPIELYVDQALAQDSAALGDLQVALTYWEDRVGRELFRFRGAFTTEPPRTSGLVNPLLAPVNQIFHEAPWRHGAQVLALNTRVESAGRIRRSLISIDRENQMCRGDCAPGSISFRKVLAHELGHFLGFDHHKSRENIMFAFYQHDLTLSDAEVDWAEVAYLIR